MQWTRRLCLPTLSLFVSYGLAQSHEFAVSDSIRMSRFSDPPAWYPQASVKYSPDRKHFLVVTSRGLIESDQVESSLWAFDSEAVRKFLEADSDAHSLKPPRPRLLARLTTVPFAHSAVPYAPVLSDARWSGNSQAIFYLGEAPNGNRRLYRVNTGGGIPQALTPEDRDVRQFDCAGDEIVYTARAADAKASADALAGDPINRDARVLTGLTLGRILFPRKENGVGDANQLWRIAHTRSWRVREAGSRQPEEIQDNGGILSLSPDARFAVQFLPVLNVPDDWSLYEPAQGFDTRKIHPGDPALVAPSNIFRLRQYALVDMKNGKSISLLNAPGGSSLAYFDENLAVWSPDGKRLLLTNTFLPFDTAAPKESMQMTRPCAAAVLVVATHETQCLTFTHINSISDQGGPSTPLRLESASFGASANEVLLQFSRNDFHRVERFLYQRDAWSKEDEPAKSASVAVGIRQTLNQPPVLWANDQASGSGKLIWDPNPQFASVKFGKASLFQWTDKSGYTWTGCLIKPPDYQATKRYPLVIQTHGFSPAQFLTDGSFPTAMAAQPLASAGIVVLQMDERRDHAVSPLEASDQVAGIEAAISQLVADGVIDPNSVGIAGFSRTSWHIEEALLHSPKAFTAAVIADGVDFSYMQYLMFGEENPELKAEFERVNGGDPFARGNLQRWIENAPGFSLDRLQTPLRIESHGGSTVLQEWETYAWLRMQHKPVDLIDISDGQHLLQKPLERLASQQGVVDWFRFWLENYERPDPEDKTEYARWRQMRRDKQVASATSGNRK
jgi:dipeptidyl aminopeptidase/acylaminoacyl peptidase